QPPCGDGKLDDLVVTGSHFVGPPRRVADAITVVGDRKDARVISEPELRDDINCPQRVPRDREKGCAVAEHIGPGELLEPVDTSYELTSELFRLLVVDQRVGMTVCGDFVPRRCNFADEIG